jgi:hypothetical protein
VGRQGNDYHGRDRDLPTDGRDTKTMHGVRQVRLVRGVEVPIVQAVHHVAEVEHQVDRDQPLGKGCGLQIGDGCRRQQSRYENDRYLGDEKLGTPDAQEISDHARHTVEPG